ncbi:MAG: hypothetical protein AMS26_17280 [Bacteroides sp. SM23_62]|nr:MAG: hypothetical protein AMS26_17280 [Bacteroides sp. SM23_62]
MAGIKSLLIKWVGLIYITKKLFQSRELKLTDFFCRKPDFLHKLSQIGVNPKIQGCFLPAIFKHEGVVSFHQEQV